MTALAKLVRRAVQKTTLPLFSVFEWAGLHVLPDHFFYPVPSSRDLRDDVFSRKSDCVGLEWNDEVQQNYLEHVFPRFVGERSFVPNAGLNVIDAAILHAMVRDRRPARLVEIGSGASTTIIAEACRLNAAEGSPCDYLVIDPYPAPAAIGSNEVSRLISKKVQDVPLDTFDDCDLLFIDSSHVAGIASDVNYEQLEIVPRTRPGCLIHFHDILLPGEYWKQWVLGNRYYWSEQYLLHAFLLFNRAFEIVWASRYMQLTHETALARVFSAYRPEFHMSSFWIRRTHDGPSR